MTMAGPITRVSPGDRWDRFEIDEVIRASQTRDLELIPYRYRYADVSVAEIAMWVDDLVAGAIEQCQRGYPAVRHGRSLVVFGPTGTGKTHAAFGALRALSASGVQCRWVALTASDLFARLRPRHGVDSEEEFGRLATAGVLVIDDIGAHKGSEWTDEILTRLINHRYQDQRPTLYISNLPPVPSRGVAGFDQVVGERVSSRLAECATELVITGPDRRRAVTS